AKIMFNRAPLGRRLGLSEKWTDDVPFRIGHVAIVALARWMLLSIHCKTSNERASEPFLAEHRGYDAIKINALVSKQPLK
ncbi:hypothetical protein, partial [Halochromatium salexigens]|uniref:hypothetical protein n=1 Tax=Halochromatium salexigens TaxID=49447 RepID=UPI001A92F733